MMINFTVRGPTDWPNVHRTPGSSGTCQRIPSDHTHLHRDTQRWQLGHWKLSTQQWHGFPGKVMMGWRQGCGTGGGVTKKRKKGVGNRLSPPPTKLAFVCVAAERAEPRLKLKFKFILSWLLWHRQWVWIVWRFMAALPRPFCVYFWSVPTCLPRIITDFIAN